MNKVEVKKTAGFCCNYEIVKALSYLCIGLALLLYSSKPSFASGVCIWDNDTSSWTTTLSNGDPINSGSARDASMPQLAIDLSGIVYVAYQQSDGNNTHIYLSRYDGRNVGFWDNDTSSWTTVIDEGDPIDTGSANDASEAKLAIDSNGVVYIAYQQFGGTGQNIYLSRYDGTDVRIWDRDTSSWITNFADGDPICNSGSLHTAMSPQIAIDSNDIVYITYSFTLGVGIRHIFLARYNGTDVRIWDRDTSSWITNFADGDPIDTGTDNPARDPKVVIDPNNVVYVGFNQFSQVGGSTTDLLYLSRYDGTDVGIWDNDTLSWATTFADGDPISTIGLTHRHQIGTDLKGTIYLAYMQKYGIGYHIYLSRYDGKDVGVWDNDTSSWTSSFVDGDPIDASGIATTGAEGHPQLGIDSNGVVYVAYEQGLISTALNIYLSRYDGNDIRIWDNDSSSWTTTLADGDPIDAGSFAISRSPQLAIDSNGFVYTVYNQHIGGNQNVYLNRYNGADVRIWDNDTVSWVTSFGAGDPIDRGTGFYAGLAQIAVDSNDIVYVTYYQSDGTFNHIYLSRYPYSDNSRNGPADEGG